MNKNYHTISMLMNIHWFGTDVSIRSDSMDRDSIQILIIIIIFKYKSDTNGELIQRN